MNTKKRKIPINLNIILVATTIFVVFIIFFDDNNLKFKAQLEDKIHHLEFTRDSLRQQIREDSIVIDGIENSDEFIERYARENFYMRREGEELYIIKEAKE